MNDRKCLQCGQKIVGRSDKKFCDTLCRNSYNNQIRNESEALIISINKKLRKNRRILQQLNPEGKTTVRRSLLDKLGFDFNFHTHTFKTSNGFIYKFCYEYGYMELTERNIEKILIVNEQPYMALKRKNNNRKT